MYTYMLPHTHTHTFKRTHTHKHTHVPVDRLPAPHVSESIEDVPSEKAQAGLGDLAACVENVLHAGAVSVLWCGVVYGGVEWCMVMSDDDMGK
jgi:hypothetical protein